MGMHMVTVSDSLSSVTSHLTLSLSVNMKVNGKWCEYLKV
eukprot:gene20255-14812_t